MSYGFAITSGDLGAIVSINSDNDAVGMFVDLFDVTYNTTVSKSYPEFYGTELYTIVMQQSGSSLNSPSTTVTNATKTVTVTSLPSDFPNARGNLTVLVLGK